MTAKQKALVMTGASLGLLLGAIVAKAHVDPSHVWSVVVSLLGLGIGSLLAWRESRH